MRSSNIPAPLLALVTLTSPVLAQQAGEGEELLGLEQVIVTAQKRAESLQDVPISMRAIDSSFLNDAGVRDLQDLALHVPSLTVKTLVAPLFGSFRIRRIGNEADIPTFEPEAGLFIDGAFRSRSGLGLSDLVDIERIEVLSGPQGTLYGKNVVAGVIGVATASPTPDFRAMLDLAADTHRATMRGYVNGSLTDAVSGRLSFSAVNGFEPYIDNSNGPDADDDGEQYALRGQLRYERDDLSLRLIAGAVRRRMNPNIADVYYGPTLRGLLNATTAFGAGAATLDPTGLTNGALNAEAGLITDGNPGNRQVQVAGGTRFEIDAHDLTAIVDYSLSDLTLTSVSAFDAYDSSTFIAGGQSPLSVLDFDDRQEGRSFSQELRFTSPDDRTVSWLGGIFYYRNEFTRGRGTADFSAGEAIDEVGVVASAGAAPVLGLPGDVMDYQAEQTNDALGVFAQAKWRITDLWSLSSGVRYSWEEKRGEVAGRTALTPGSVTLESFGVTPVMRALNPGAFAQERDWSRVTWSVNLSRQFAPGVMGYAVVSTGYKAGGFNLGFGASPATARPFDAERVTNYEVGFKSELWDARVRFNLAIFDTRYDDYQNASWANLQYLVNNAEQVKVTGAESDVIVLLGRGLTANASVSYVDAKYERYTAGSCYAARALAGTTVCDLSGRTLPFAPKLKGNVGLGWEGDAPLASLYARADVSFESSQYVNTTLDPRNVQNRHASTNVRLGWRNEHLDVSLYGTNVFNDRYVIQATSTAIWSSVDDSFLQWLGRPAEVGLQVRYTF